MLQPKHSEPSSDDDHPLKGGAVYPDVDGRLEIVSENSGISQEISVQQDVLIEENALVGEFKKVGSVVAGPDGTLYYEVDGVVSPLFSADDLEVANRLRSLRNERHLDKSQAAELYGVSKSQVTYVESGDRSPRLDTLRRFANGLGYTVKVSFSPR